MRKTIILYALTLCMILGGCASHPAGEEKSENNKEQTGAVAFPENYESIVEKVAFQTKVVVPEAFSPEGLRFTQASQRMPIQETVKTVLMDGWEDKTIREEFDEQNYYHILTDDLHSLSVSTGIFYRGPNGYYYNNSMKFDQEGFLVNRDPLSIDGLDPEKIKGQWQELMSTLGFAAECCETELFALPHERMAEDENATDIEENFNPEAAKPSWSKEDDAYYLVGRQTLQGLPVFHQYVFPDYTDFDAPIRMIWSRRGLESLEVAYYFDFQEQKETVRLADFEKAAACVADKYNNILTDANYVVTEAVLYQAVLKTERTEEYQVRPAWLFRIEEISGEQKNILIMLVDAETGEEIIL